MSFDKYVHHISQKYRLAVAISVIKSKPENISIEEYLIQLQNNIRDKEMDPNETVCSDDFNFDDDGICNENHDTQTDCTKNDMLNENHLECLVNANVSRDSQTILNDFVFEDESDAQRENSLGDTIRLLKNVCSNVLEVEQPYSDQNFSQMTFCESQDDNAHCYSNKIIENNKHPDIAIDNNLDSQETQLYTLHGFTQDYSHVSQTQSEYFVISDKYIRNNARNLPDNVMENAQNRHMTQLSVSQSVVAINADETITIEKSINEDTVNAENTFINTESEQFHSRNDAEINKTGALSKIIIANVTKNIVKEIENENNQNTTFQINIDNSTGASKLHNMNDAGCRKDVKETYITRTKTNDTYANNTPVLFNSQNTVFTHANDKMQNLEQDQCSQINNEITQNNNTVNTNQEIIEDMDVDEMSSDENVEERVPFKVIEELNRVKTFLNRKEKKYDGYSTDSGYRSDSQHRGSLRSSSQLSGIWLNQSAHCLFTHIMRALPTDDFVKEIAQVLGKLIDKLHEDENYPQFLEEFLETVDGLVRDIHTGDGWADHLLLTKDEKTQRVLLLNKSKHILKYSIEKITALLELVYTNLMQENLYECTNIVDLENVCYIFNILEIFIKRYRKVKDVSSQSQNSQDVLPKRSSLTELWRKKWNPNCKEIVRVESKICVLKPCSDILNKIIVECMSGYSLVAFAALQCFNLIQD